MDDRAKIISRIPRAKNSSPPELPPSESVPGSAETFSEKLAAIGGACVALGGNNELRDFIRSRYPQAKRIVSFYKGLDAYTEEGGTPHQFQDCDVAVVRAEFAVAENGAVWIPDASLNYQVLPFITQHLVAIILRDEIVPNMHDAYERIGKRDYSFATFIAGPSKTADIEQSLVLGAHGPKSMTVVILNNNDISSQ